MIHSLKYRTSDTNMFQLEAFISIENLKTTYHKVSFGAWQEYVTTILMKLLKRFLVRGYKLHKYGHTNST